MLANPYPFRKSLRYIEAVAVKSCSSAARALLLICLFTILLIPACKRGPLQSNEVAYVAAPQVNLRDRLAAIYNRVGTASNGERVEILDRQKRFAKVRTAAGLEGWVEQRYLVPEETFEAFQKLAEENKETPAQGQGATRAALNMHITPARDSEKLYQLSEAEKVQILKRATAERPSKQQPAVTKPVATDGGAPEQRKLYDDWWLVRNSQGRIGWVLARMVDLDVPIEIAQYSEGQRIISAYVINKLQDGDKQVPQYLVLFSENKDGLPFDYNQARVFTWNPRKSRYETAYRERGLAGYLPVTVATENFEREGTLPTFTLRVRLQDGTIADRKYKLNQPIVRRVLAPGEQPQIMAASPNSDNRKRRRR